MLSSISLGRRNTRTCATQTAKQQETTDMSSDSSHNRRTHRHTARSFHLVVSHAQYMAKSTANEHPFHLLVKLRAS